MVNIFILQKISPERDRLQPSLYICYNFGQIFCTNVIQFFSVENMGHNQLQKCTKYHLVSLLNEKQRSTFANFLHFFYPVTLLTHSALFQNYYRCFQQWIVIVTCHSCKSMSSPSFPICSTWSRFSVTFHLKTIILQQTKNEQTNKCMKR